MCEGETEGDSDKGAGPTRRGLEVYRPSGKYSKSSGSLQWRCLSGKDWWESRLYVEVVVHVPSVY